MTPARIIAEGSSRNEIAKMARHGSKVVGHENPVLSGGDCQDIRIIDPVKPGGVSAPNTNARFPSLHAANNRAFEVRIRQEARRHVGCPKCSFDRSMRARRSS